MIQKVGRTVYEHPRFPDYPYDEWRARIKKARDSMDKHGADCLVVWERENNRYFFGFQSIHWYVKSIQCAVGIIPLEGDPILIVPYLFLPTTEGITWVNDIRGVPEAHQPNVQRGLPGDVADVIKEIGYGNKRIALETGPLGGMYIPRPVTDIDAFRAALPDAKFVNGDRIIWDCRMIKSPLEVDRIRKSVAATAAIQAAIVEGYRPGMTEVDVIKILYRAAAEQDGVGLGDDGFAYGHFVASAQKRGFADIMASEGAPITREHAIEYDCTFLYKGYSPDIARVWQVGPITDELRRIYATVFAAEDAAGDMLKPGVKANEVYEAMYKVVREAGYSPIDMGGHGTGLDLHEPPSIDALNEQVIEDGMTLSIEPWFLVGGEAYGQGELYGIQDTFVITDTGCYKIEGLDRNIIQVYHPI